MVPGHPLRTARDIQHSATVAVLCVTAFMISTTAASTVQLSAVFVMQGSNLAINTMLLDAESLPELAGIVEEWHSSFDPIHTATAFYMAGSLAQGNRSAIAGARPLLDQLAGVWDMLLPSAGAQALSNVLWACSKLLYANPTLWSSTVAKFIQLLQESDDVADQSVSNVMYSLATIASVNNSVVPGLSKAELEEAAAALCRRMQVRATNPTADAVSPQHLANTLWGCAKLAINPGTAVLNSLLQAMAREQVIVAATSQELSNTLWAVSVLEPKCGWQPQLPQRAWQRLLGELQLARVANTGTAQNVANALVALGCLAGSTKAAAGNTRRSARSLHSTLLFSCCRARWHGSWTGGSPRTSPTACLHCHSWTCLRKGSLTAQWQLYLSTHGCHALQLQVWC
jgi:hypothetical protein